MALIRLQKYLSECSVASRRKSEELINAGKVKVNGKIAVVGDKIDPKKDTVTVSGKKVVAVKQKYYIMLNKPRGYVTTMSDELGRKCVAELVQDVGATVYPVGRLDRDSEGLLLLTNDGEQGYEHWRKNGATTFHEYWGEARSHNHPMFGAVAAYLFDYILGIREEADKAGYNDILIAPVLIDGLDTVNGKRTVPAGEITISYEKKDGKIDFVVCIPDGLTAEFRVGDTKQNLAVGENRISCAL